MNISNNQNWYKDTKRKVMWVSIGTLMLIDITLLSLIANIFNIVLPGPDLVCKTVSIMSVQFNIDIHTHILPLPLLFHWMNQKLTESVGTRGNEQENVSLWFIYWNTDFGSLLFSNFTILLLLFFPSLSSFFFYFFFVFFFFFNLLTFLLLLLNLTRRSILNQWSCRYSC